MTKTSSDGAGSNVTAPIAWPIVPSWTSSLSATTRSPGAGVRNTGVPGKRQRSAPAPCEYSTRTTCAAPSALTQRSRTSAWACSLPSVIVRSSRTPVSITAAQFSSQRSARAISTIVTAPVAGSTSTFAWTPSKPRGAYGRPSTFTRGIVGPT